MQVGYSLWFSATFVTVQFGSSTAQDDVLVRAVGNARHRDWNAGPKVEYIYIHIGIKYTLNCYLSLRFWYQGKEFRRPDVHIKGKVVIVTGCNTGIGKETALELAKRGGRIYMACRDYTRCEDARLDIIAQSGNPNVFNRHLDLSSLASVRKFVQE